MEYKINNFCGGEPIYVGGNIHPDLKIGAIVSLTQSHGAMSLNHSMTPAGAREMAAALVACADALDGVPNEPRAAIAKAIGGAA
ncbi:MAG: hypothetical protein JJD98_00345 [Polaromonas sp.]|nr:hypothetical protein [Polaromonas sp.]